MKDGKILGFELNEKTCQISFYNEASHEPETLETAVENYQLPLVLGYYQNAWVYGREAEASGDD